MWSAHGNLHQMHQSVRWANAEYGFLHLDMNYHHAINSAFVWMLCYARRWEFNGWFLCHQNDGARTTSVPGRHRGAMKTSADQLILFVNGCFFSCSCSSRRSWWNGGGFSPSWRHSRAKTAWRPWSSGWSWHNCRWHLIWGTYFITSYRALVHLHAGKCTAGVVGPVCAALNPCILTGILDQTGSKRWLLWLVCRKERGLCRVRRTDFPNSHKIPEEYFR